MKKFIYLLAFSFAFVNYSCTTLANLFGGAGVCNCTCAACVNCTGKHHVLTEEQKAALEAQQLKQAQEDAKRQAELDSLLNMDYTIVHYDLPEVKNDPYKWDDDEEITTPKDSLLALFNVNSKNGELEFIHKGINTNEKENDCYIYFTTDKDGVPSPLRLVVHYYADDPINFYMLKFTLGRFPYEFTPTKINRSNDGKFYTENFDNALDVNSRDIVAGLAQCKYANILLVSKDVSHRLYLTDKQIERFRNTYKLYRLMGGKL
jgi:hypothetical protein